MAEDFDKLKQAPYQTQAQLAMIDDLTGLFNRRFFYKALKEQIQKAKENKESITLVLIDCDYFKDVNDTYGHGFGDKVLIDIGKILKASIRNIDLVARYGGDEFVVILPKAGAENAMPIARRLRQKASEFKFIDPKTGQAFNLSLSVGLAVYPLDAKTAQDLFDQADKALYSSKKAGRDRISQIKDVAIETELESQLVKNIVHPKFIDRENELSQLRQFFEITSKEKAKRIVLLNGETGVGKTRIMQEFSKEVMVKDNACLLGSCSPQESLQSYAPLLKAFNEYLKTIRIDELDALISQLELNQRQALGGFIEPIAEYLKEKKEISNLQDADRRYHLFHGLFQMLLNIAKKKPTVLFLDNLHWADSGTLNLLRYFVLSVEDVPIIIIGAYSKNQLRELDLPGYTMLKFIQDISKFQVLPDIEIGPIQEKSIADFVEFLFPKLAQKERLAKLLIKITKGNPLFLLETIQFLLERKIIFVKENNWDLAEIEESAVPDSFDKLMEQRIKALDDETKEVLAHASGIGEDFGADLLNKVEEANEGQMLDKIDKAKKAHIVESAQALSDENFYFLSDGVRAAVLKHMDDKNRKQLHLKLGQIIEKENKENLEDVAGKLAHYFKQADMAQKAQDYTRRALKKAQELFTSEDALRYLQEAWQKREEREKEEEIDPDSAQEIINFIRVFLTAVRNVQFYPEVSEFRKKSGSESYLKIIQILDRYKNVTISQVAEVIEKRANRILLNGRQLVFDKKERVLEQAFLDVMRENDINSITFKFGMSEREYVALLEGLAAKKEKLKRGDELIEFLGMKGVLKIKIDAIKYRRLFTETERKESRKRFIEDMVITEALFEGRGAGVLEPGEVTVSEEGGKGGADITIEEFKKGRTEEAARAKEDQTRQTLRDLIAGLGKDTKDVLDMRAHTISREEETVLESLLLKLPDDAVIDTIIGEYKKREGPILDIKFLISKLLSESERRERLAPLLEKRLKDAGLSNEGFEWIIMGEAWEKLFFEKKVNLLLSATPKTYIEIGFSENIKPVFEALLSREKPDTSIIKNMLDKLFENFKAPSWKIRQFAAKAVKELVDICANTKQDKIIIEIFSQIQGYAEKERQNEVLWFLVNALEKISDYSIKNDLYDVSFRSLKILTLISQKDSDYPKESKEKAGNILKDLSTEEHILKLARKFEEIKGPGHKAIAGALVYLGEGSIDYILDILMRIGGEDVSYDAFLLISEIVEMLKKIDGPYLQKIRERLNSEVWHFVRNLVVALGLIKDEASVELLKIPLKNKEIKVRYKTIYTLSKIGGKKALEMLLPLLKDKDPRIKKEALKAIEAIGDKDAIPVLEEVLADKKISREASRLIELFKKKK